MPEEQATAEEYSEGPPRIQAADADERLAGQIRERREDAGMSQADLAKAMKAGGVTWYAQTVHRVEAGTRKVSAGEAAVLAEIFGTTADRLTWPGKVASAAGLLDMYTFRAERAHQQAGEWAGILLFSQAHLEANLSRLEKDGYLGSAELRRLAGDARDAMRLSPEDAVAEARRREEEARREEGEEEPDDERG